MTDEQLTGLLLKVLGALPNSDDMRIARAIAAAAKAEEREAAAAICDEFEGRNKLARSNEYERAAADGAMWCASAIRARGGEGE